MDNLTGKRLGSYQIVAPLGEGNMATVYRALASGTNRYVALKVLRRHLSSDRVLLGRFRQEATVVANLRHPHILPMHDFGEVEGYTFIAMPLVENGTLAHHLRGDPLPADRVERAIAQLGDALHYAHELGVVHRDVKPSNVLIDARGDCLLADFGIAKMLSGSAQFTATGVAIGTPTYMSPEQGLGQKIDRRSDVYSLGVLLYQMATGQVPFKASTPVAVVLKHVNDPPLLPRTLNPMLPEALEHVILTALAKQPDRRYSTTAGMVQALYEAIGARG